MPPKYRGGYRRSGYTRSTYKGRTTARPSPYKKKYSGKGSSRWGGRKYTGGRAVVGVKSVVPTTVAARMQRVEVKQHLTYPLDTSPDSSQSQAFVPAVIYSPSLEDITVNILKASYGRFLFPVAGLQNFADADLDGTNDTFGDWDIGTQGGTIEAPTLASYAPYRNLLHISEGYEHNKRIGRVINLMQLNFMVSAQSLVARDFVMNGNKPGQNTERVPSRRPTVWHLIVLLEKQVPTSNHHMPLEQMMRTMYDLEGAYNIETGLLAQKNRYTADAHGRVLLRKKIVIDDKSTAVSRRFQIKFKKPLEVRYRGSGGSEVAENRITSYLFPTSPIGLNNLWMSEPYTLPQGDDDNAAEVVPDFHTYWTFTPSVCNMSVNAMFTDP